MPDPLKTIQGKSGIPSPDIGNKVRLSLNLPAALAMGYPLRACNLYYGVCLFLQNVHSVLAICGGSTECKDSISSGITAPGRLARFASQH